MLRASLTRPQEILLRILYCLYTKACKLPFSELYMIHWLFTSFRGKVFNFPLHNIKNVSFDINSNPIDKYFFKIKIIVLGIAKSKKMTLFNNIGKQR